MVINGLKFNKWELLQVAHNGYNLHWSEFIIADLIFGTFEIVGVQYSEIFEKSYDWVETKEYNVSKFPTV